MLTSCNNKTNKVPYQELGETKILVGRLGAEKNIAASSDCEWAIKYILEWYVIDKITGDSKLSFLVMILPNKRPVKIESKTSTTNGVIDKDRLILYGWSYFWK